MNSLIIAFLVCVTLVPFVRTQYLMETKCGYGKCIYEVSGSPREGWMYARDECIRLGFD